MPKIDSRTGLLEREQEVMRILALFLERNLDFVVVGGYAVSTYKKRFSIDLDLVIREENLEEFEELLTDFEMPFQVALLNARTREISLREYSPGEDIVIPRQVIHWLINPNTKRLEFTCEYAPHPWDGLNDEPEFENLDALFRFVDERGLRERVLEAKF